MGFKHQGNGQRRNKLELLAIKLAVFSFSKEKRVKEHTLSAQGSLVLPFENGRNKEQTYDQIQQTDLALSSKSKEAYHSRIPAFSNEYSSRQGFKEKNRLSRVASSSQRFSSRFSITRFSNNKYICFPSMPSSTSIYSLASRPLQSRDGCNDAKLSYGSLFGFPLFSMISRLPLKIKQECISLLILIAPLWSTQPWYTGFLNLCVKEPVLLPQEKEILISPKVLSTY